MRDIFPIVIQWLFYCIPLISIVIFTLNKIGIIGINPVAFWISVISLCFALSFIGSFYRGELSTKTMIIPSFVCAGFFAVYGIVRWYKEWIG